MDVSSLALNLPTRLAKLGIKVQVNTVASDGASSQPCPAASTGVAGG